MLSDVEPNIHTAGLTLDGCRELCLSSPTCKLVVYGEVSGDTWAFPRRPSLLKAS